MPQEIQANYYPLNITVDNGVSSPANPSTNIPAVVIKPENVVSAAGGSILKDGFLQSPNFVKSYAGWRLGSDDSVEFGTGIFRGTLTGATITGGTIQTAASGQRITINGADNYIKIYSASALIGAFGGSTDATGRLLDLTPSTDTGIVRIWAKNTTGTASIQVFSIKLDGYQIGLNIWNNNLGATRTTDSIPLINLYNVGTGSGLKFTNDATNSDGKVFDIAQSKVATTEPIFKVQQDGITSTNFRKIFTEVNTGVSIWVSNGTTPNGNLTGVLGDICIGGDSGNIYRCSTAGTTWTAM